VRFQPTHQEKKLHPEPNYSEHVARTAAPPAFRDKSKFLPSTFFVGTPARQFDLSNSLRDYRWSSCAPEPVDLFCLIPFRVAVGVRSNEDPSGDPKKSLEEN
jgi:hypothetical protein